MCNLLVFVWSPWDLGATAKSVPPWRYWVQHEDSASYEGESKINLVYACFRDGGGVGSRLIGILLFELKQGSFNYEKESLE